MADRRGEPYENLMLFIQLEGVPEFANVEAIVTATPFLWS